MKKLILSLGVAAMLTIGLSSCSKCNSCTESNGTVGPEFCKGNAIEDLAHAAAESACEISGGTWD